MKKSLLMKKAFIELLKFGEEKGFNGTTFDEIEKWAVQNKIISNVRNNEEKFLLREWFFSSFANNTYTTKDIWVLKPESYVMLSSYREAKKNFRLTIAVFFVSLITLFVTIYSISQ